MLTKFLALSKYKRYLLLPLALVLCALMAWSGAQYALWQFRQEPLTTAWNSGQNTGASLWTASANSLPDFVEACEISTPAVVYIKTTSTQNMRSFNDWFFGDFFQ
ncbi:MAG: hypothetical protein ACO31H_06745, partial [Bacteroidia bacterium]